MNAEPFPYLWHGKDRAFGTVCVRGTRVSTTVLYVRWLAEKGHDGLTGEQAIEHLARDYDLPQEAVTAAIAYELGRRHDTRPDEWQESLAAEGTRSETT